MSYGRLALLCLALTCVQAAVMLYASHGSSRKYSAELVGRYFSPDYVRRAGEYHEARLAGQRVLVPVELLLPLVFVFGGVLTFLSRKLAPLHPVTQGVLIMAAFVLFTELCSLPLQYRYGYLLERRFGFSNQAPRGYLGDVAKGLLIGLILTAAVTAICIALYRALPRTWPWIVGGTLAALTVFLTLIFPWVVEPLFFDFHDLPPGDLRSGIEEIAASHGIRIERILEMKASAKTNRTNAYVSGLWGSHRVVLFDTLLRKNTQREILSVVAHEMGHSVKDHVALGMGLSIGGIAVALLLVVLLLPRLAGLFPVTLPPGNLAPLLPLLLVLLSLGGFLIGPLASFISRTMEAQADRFALDTTADPEAAISMEKKLTEDNLIDPNPRWLSHVLFASHPDSIARIRAAEMWRGM